MTWDELSVLRLPGMRQALARQLQQSETEGLRFLAQAARSPFQRWAAQVVLQSHLHSHAAPIQFFYTLLTDHSLNAYIFALVDKDGWAKLPSVRCLLLGELDGRWVNCSSDPFGRISERLVWGLTWLLRDRRRTPLTRFAGMLYELLGESQETRFFLKNLVSHAKTYTGLTSYPGGEEIARTFEAMAAYLSYEDMSILSTARNQVFLKNLVSPPSAPPSWPRWPAWGRSARRSPPTRTPSAASANWPPSN